MEASALHKLARISAGDQGEFDGPAPKHELNSYGGETIKDESVLVSRQSVVAWIWGQPVQPIKSPWNFGRPLTSARGQEAARLVPRAVEANAPT